MEEVTADVVGTAELELELADGTDLLQSHNKTGTDKELLLSMSRESGFLR